MKPDVGHKFAPTSPEKMSLNYLVKFRTIIIVTET